MIKFHTVKYKNFLSVGNKFLKIELDKHSTVLLSGNSGRGKSILLDAITFVLYNKPFRKINKPQLVNTINKSNLEVEIEFSTNNKSYKVCRGIKPNIFEIYEDEVLLNQASDSRDYQDYLERVILKMNYKSFTQIVIVGHATYMPFMKLSSADRRNIVENLLDIDIFSKMNIILKQKIAATKEDINEVSYQYDLTKEKKKIHNDNLENSRANVASKIEQNQKAIDELEIQRTIKQDLINQMNSEIDNLLINNSDIQNIRSQITKFSEFEITFKNKIKNVNKEIKFFSENDICSTCHQDIANEFKENTIEERKKELKKYDTGLNKAKEKILSLETMLDQAQAKMNELTKMRDSISKKTMELNFLEKEILRIHKETQLLTDNKGTDLAILEKEYDMLQQQEENLLSERDKLLLSQHINSLAGIMLKDDGIKTKIIRNYLPTMNKLINKYLGMMDFYINFHLDENFEEVIKLANKETFTYFSFSEGEKLRIDLAILFAWREIARLRNSASTNLLIIDEVFDSSLDAAGIDDFLKIINSFGDKSNIFIISHKEEVLSDRFVNTLKFEKVKGFTKIT